MIVYGYFFFFIYLFNNKPGSAYGDTISLSSRYSRNQWVIRSMAISILSYSVTLLIPAFVEYELFYVSYDDFMSPETGSYVC